jgi:sugar/nucleoside kinase (ribokinase family)
LACYVHIAALSSAQRQLDFLHVLRQQSPVISVGTYARLVYHEPERVRQLVERADLFFMNENEARGLFGTVAQAKTRPGATLFVTLDAQGVLVIAGEHQTYLPGEPVAEVDPTGAGDTFCGATLAGLGQGLSAVEAARRAIKLAGQTVGVVGPAALW